MFCGNSMMFNISLILNTCDFKYCQHSFQVTNEQLPSIRISEDHDMCVVQVLRILIDIFQLHISPGIKSYVMKDHHNLFKEVIYLYRRFQLCCNQNFNWSVILKDIVELIEHSLIVFFHKLLTSLLLIFNSNGFLASLCRQFLPIFSLLHLNLIFNDVSLIVYFYSLLLILNLIRLLLKGSRKLLHTLWTLFYNLSFWFCSYLFFVRFASYFFCHC